MVTDRLKPLIAWKVRSRAVVTGCRCSQMSWGYGILPDYPLVNIQKTMENHHFKGKTHYFDWAIFNSHVKLPEGRGWKIRFPLKIADHWWFLDMVKLPEGNRSMNGNQCHAVTIVAVINSSWNITSHSWWTKLKCLWLKGIITYITN